MEPTESRGQDRDGHPRAPSEAHPSLPRPGFRAERSACKQNDLRTRKPYFKAAQSIFKRNAREIQPVLFPGGLHFDRPGDVCARWAVCQKRAHCVLIVFFPPYYQTKYVLPSILEREGSAVHFTFPRGREGGRGRRRERNAVSYPECFFILVRH